MSKRVRCSTRHAGPNSGTSCSNPYDRKRPMKNVSWAAKGVCLCCVSIAGTLVCLTQEGAAQPRSESSAPNKETPLQPIKPPKCGGSIDVHIVDAITHQPVAATVITANGVTVGITDEDGHFLVGKLCQGTVAIEATRGDYATEQVDVAVDVGKTSLELEMRPANGEVVLIAGERARTIDMRSSTEVTGEALERTRGRSFSDTLADVPGVSQLRSGNGLGKPIVRGQFGRRLLLLVDGLRHRSQEWGLDHAPEVDPFIADGITVVRGAAGVRYGPDAIGGALLVTPPRLLKKPGSAGEAHFIGFAAQGGSTAARLQFAPESLPGFAAQVEGSVKRLAASSTPDYALDNTGSSEANLGATVGYRTDGVSYLLSYRRYMATLGVCNCLRLESSEDFLDQLERSEPIDAANYESKFEINRPYQEVAHDTVLARVEWSALSSGTATASYGLQNDARKEFDVVRTATGPQFDFLLTSHDAELRFEHNPYHLNDHMHLRGSMGLVGFGQQHSYRGLPLVPDYTAFGAGAYAVERLLGHDYEVEVGVRYDGMQRTASIERRDFLRLVRSDQIAEDACSDPEQDSVECGSTFHTLSGTIGGLLQLSEPLSVKMNLATASRAPNPDEQYLNGTSPTFPVLGLGKPDLGTETSYSGSLTGSYQAENLVAEFSTFANYISDYIYFAPAINENGEPIFDVLIRGVFPRFTTKPVNAIFYGADGGLVYKPFERLKLGAQLSMVRAKNITDDSFLVFVPPDRLRGNATYTHEFANGGEKAYLSLTSTFVAKQDRFDLQADLVPPPESYFLLDAEVGWATKLGDTPIKVSAQATNLLGKRYRDYTSLLRYFSDQPGLEVLMRLSFQFSNPSS